MLKGKIVGSPRCPRLHQSASNATANFKIFRGRPPVPPSHTLPWCRLCQCRRHKHLLLSASWMASSTGRPFSQLQPCPMLWACVIHGAQFMISRQKQRSPQLVAQEQSQSTALIPIIGFFTIYFKHWANKISTKKLSWLILLTLTLLQRQSSKMWHTCISRLIIIYR